MAKRKVTPTQTVENVLDEARKADGYLVAIWTRKGDKLKLWWKTEQFLQGDFPLALAQLDRDLREHHRGEDAKQQ